MPEKVESGESSLTAAKLLSRKIVLKNSRRRSLEVTVFSFWHSQHMFKKLKR